MSLLDDLITAEKRVEELEALLLAAQKEVTEIEQEMRERDEDYAQQEWNEYLNEKI